MPQSGQSRDSPRYPREHASKAIRMLPLKLNDPHPGTSLSSAISQDLHTLSPWMFSPQGGPAVDHRDSPADVGVRGQRTDPWVLVKSLHSLLEAGRREGNGHRRYIPLGRVPCWALSLSVKAGPAASVSDPPILISNHSSQVLGIEPTILTC